MLATAQSWQEDRLIDQPKVAPHAATLASWKLCWIHKVKDLSCLYILQQGLVILHPEF